LKTMKIKLLKFITAVISLLIGFAIVLSLSPKQALEPTDQTENLDESESIAFFEYNGEAKPAPSCTYSSERYTVRFTAYQRPEVKLPGVDYQQAFCESLPSLGRTHITLDLMTEGMREKSVALKFIRLKGDGFSGENLEKARVINESYHERAPRGMVQYEMDFVERGFYLLIVEIGNGILSENEVIKVPFEVGAN